MCQTSRFKPIEQTPRYSFSIISLRINNRHFHISIERAIGNIPITRKKWERGAGRNRNWFDRRGMRLVKGGKISLPASFEIPSPSSTTFTPIPRRSDRSAKFLETTTLTRFLIHWRGNLGFWIRDVKRNRVCAAAFPVLIDYYFIFSAKRIIYKFL